MAAPRQLQAPATPPHVHFVLLLCPTGRRDWLAIASPGLPVPPLPPAVWLEPKRLKPVEIREGFGAVEDGCLLAPLPR